MTILRATIFLIACLLASSALAQQTPLLFRAKPAKGLSQVVSAFSKPLQMAASAAESKDYDVAIAHQLLTRAAPLVGAFAKGIDRQLLLVDPQDDRRQQPDIALVYMVNLTYEGALAHGRDLRRVTREDVQLDVGDRCLAFTYLSSGHRSLVIYVSASGDVTEHVACVGEAVLGLLEVHSELAPEHWASWAAGGDQPRSNQALLAAFERAVRERARGGSFDARRRLSQGLRSMPRRSSR